uniref:DNA methyltransferase n=1 Tax=Candidatus Electronema sp. TaxID=2698783 RepID=UPI004056C43C
MNNKNDLGKKMKNRLYYGDNLKILQEYIPTESVDLIYLDPPFNSNRSYNVLFKDESGRDSEAQLTAFEDTWHWDMAAAEIYKEIVTSTSTPTNVKMMIGALREFIGTNPMMAYLVMMTARLLELHRVLKPTGSLYLHCDQTASHYLKIVLDTIFGTEFFRNEIIWQRTTAGKPVYRNIPKNADHILWYAKTQKYIFNQVFQPGQTHDFYI